MKHWKHMDDELKEHILPNFQKEEANNTLPGNTAPGRIP
jgi:hypothetical protein